MLDEPPPDVLNVGRLKYISTQSGFSKLSYEDCSIDISVSAATAVNISFAQTMITPFQLKFPSRVRFPVTTKVP